MKKVKSGFTLVEIMIVVAIIGLLAAIAVPSLLKARQETQRKLIINNLRLVEDARDQVMTVSNFTSYASLSAEMVGEFLRAGSVTNMNWPTGTLGIELDLAGDKTGDVEVDLVDQAADHTEWVTNRYIGAQVQFGGGDQEHLGTGRGAD